MRLLCFSVGLYTVYIRLTDPYSIRAYTRISMEPQPGRILADEG